MSGTTQSPNAEPGLEPSLHDAQAGAGAQCGAPLPTPLEGTLHALLVRAQGQHNGGAQTIEQIDSLRGKSEFPRDLAV